LGRFSCFFRFPEWFPLLGGHPIAWYGVLWALAFLFGYIIMSKIYKREGMTEKSMDQLTLYMLISSVVGARLGHCLFYEPEYYLSHPIEILKIWEGGLASHGGAIGILLGLWLYVRKVKRPYIWILDRIVIVVALAGALIRLGNLMNSEIYGFETTLPWGFVFVRDGQEIPRHPTQIYEALFCIVAFIWLMFLYYKKDAGRKQPGLLFGLFLLIIFGSRIAIEFLKEVQVDFEKGMVLDMGQWLSVPFVLAGVFFLIWSFYNKKKLEAQPSRK
jgi:prolipoprotein diacylglyceryl transferase